MARTWTLHQTLTFTGGTEKLDDNRTLFPMDIDQANNVIYFFTVNSGGTGNGSRVYSYDGTTLTDISGTSFTGADDLANGILFFGSGVYVFVEHPTALNCTIHKYDGSGQTWTLKHTISADHNVYTGPFVARDASRMVYVGLQSTGGAWESTDGATWTEITLDAGDDKVTAPAYGLNHYGGYSENLVINSAWNRVMHKSGSNWIRIYGSDTFNPGVGFLGHDGTYSFWYQSPNQSRSTDWGDTKTDLTAIAPVLVSVVGTDATMAVSETTNEMFTYSGTNFAADGTCGVATNDTKAVFRLSTTMYALVKPSSNGSCYVYAGGTVAVAGTTKKFHYGLDSLTERSDLLFPVVGPGGLAVRLSDNKVAIAGSESAGGQIINTKVVDDNYVADTDITDSHATGTAINGVEWIN